MVTNKIDIFLRMKRKKSNKMDMNDVRMQGCHENARSHVFM